MTALAHTDRFVPGTTGWTAGDLDDPQIARRWFEGRYEIVEGVLTTMPAAYFIGSLAVGNLLRLLGNHIESTGMSGWLGPEADIVLNETRVVVADGVFLTPDDQTRQVAAVGASRRVDSEHTRLLIAPTLVIESVSAGHDAHDRLIKRRWYAEAGVPHYWIIDAFQRSIDCLVRDGANYRIEQSGRGNDELRPSLFPGLVIPMAKVWGSWLA